MSPRYSSLEVMIHCIPLLGRSFYELYQTNPKASEDDFKHYASTVFLSALAIKLDDLPTVGYDPQLRLYRLLDMEGKPSRSEVLASLLEHPLYKVVDDDIKTVVRYHGGRF